MSSNKDLGWIANVPSVQKPENKEPEWFEKPRTKPPEDEGCGTSGTDDTNPALACAYRSMGSKAIRSDIIRIALEKDDYEEELKRLKQKREQDEQDLQRQMELELMIHFLSWQWQLHAEWLERLRQEQLLTRESVPFWHRDTDRGFSR